EIGHWWLLLCAGSVTTTRGDDCRFDNEFGRARRRRVGDGGCLGSGGEENGGEERARDGDAPENWVGAVEAMDEGVARCATQLMGGGYEARVFQRLCGDERAAGGGCGGVGRLGGGGARNFLVGLVWVEGGGDAAGPRDAEWGAEEWGGVVHGRSDAGFGG